MTSGETEEVLLLWEWSIYIYRHIYTMDITTRWGEGGCDQRWQWGRKGIRPSWVTRGWMARGGTNGAPTIYVSISWRARVRRDSHPWCVGAPIRTQRDGPTCRPRTEHRMVGGYMRYTESTRGALCGRRHSLTSCFFFTEISFLVLFSSSFSSLAFIFNFISFPLALATDKRTPAFACYGLTTPRDLYDDYMKTWEIRWERIAGRWREKIDIDGKFHFTVFF